jgi:hypothetical protein
MAKRKREKRPRAYPAFPAGSDQYGAAPEMTDVHARWHVRVDVIDEAEMARRHAALKLRGPLPDDPYAPKGAA